MTIFSSDGDLLCRAISDSDGKFRLFYIEQDSYKLKAAWGSRNSDETENWPEDITFNIERPLQIKENIELDIDMQSDIVTNIHTGQKILSE